MAKPRPQPTQTTNTTRGATKRKVGIVRSPLLSTHVIYPSWVGSYINLVVTTPGSVQSGIWLRSGAPVSAVMSALMA
jgi:hypothetical protein